jgi:2-dehydro-3-deoxyphosphogalactonate aldolase
MTLDDALAELPIVAIIRGVTPDEAVAVGEALVEAGVRVIETPLNSPDPFTSIRRLADALDGRAVVGAGTVLTPEAVERTADAGGRIVVSPDTRPEVIARTVELGLGALPGFGTASEAFRAYDAGARRLKLFPASTFGSGHVSALRAVLPADAVVMAVGGVSPPQMAQWWAAGCRGFGLGGDLYKPGWSPEQVGDRARAAVLAAQALG